MKSSKRHVAFISLIFLLKCLSKSIFIKCKQKTKTNNVNRKQETEIPAPVV